MRNIMATYDPLSDHMPTLERFVNSYLVIYRSLPPRLQDELSEQARSNLANNTDPMRDLWDETAHFSLLVAREGFRMARAPFDERSFMALHQLAMRYLPEKDFDPQLLTIPSHILYERLSMAIASGRRGSFNSDGKWPTHSILDNSLQANFLMRPDNKIPLSLLEQSPQYNSLRRLMEDRLEFMDELTMDVLHIISARWLESGPGSPTEQIRLTADDILEARGVQKHLNGSGERYGYTQSQRDAIQDRMAALSCIWVSVNSMNVTIREGGKRTRKSTRFESPALVITGRFGEVGEDGDVELWSWNVRPGDVFSTFLLNPVSREVGPFPKKSLYYDPKYHSWEKRLSVYIFWQHRIRRSREKNGFTLRVESLLKGINEEIDASHPIRTRERLENSLDTLQRDGLLKSWQYSSGCDELPTYKWGKVWLGWKIYIKPMNIEDEPEFSEDKSTQLSLLEPEKAITGETLKELRLQSGLTQLQTANFLGVARSLISQIEAGKRSISPLLMVKIERWRNIGNP